MTIKPIELERRDKEGGGREYLCPNGEWYPSVTTILSATRDNSWIDEWRQKVGEEEADKILAERAESGDKAHKCAEEYIQWVDIKTEKEKKAYTHDSPYIPAIEKVINGYVHNPSTYWYSEIAVWHPLGFAGTLDLLRGWHIEDNGDKEIVYTLHDFKTKLSKDASKWKNWKYKQKATHDYFVQQSAYAACIAHMYKILVRGICTEIIFDDGNYMSFGQNKDRMKEYWKEFVERLNEYSQSRS